MTIIQRVIEAVLPSQQLMEMERAYINRTGHSPTKQQEKRWKKDIKQGGSET